MTRGSQISKFSTGNPVIDRMQDHYIAVLNPLLKALPPPTQPFANVLDYDAVPDGTVDLAPSLKAAWDDAAVAYVPQGSFLISELSVPFGKSLLAAGPQKTILSYPGSASAITLDGCQGSELAGFKLLCTGVGAGVRGIELKNTTVDSKWNRLVNLHLIQNSGTPRISGQVGLLLNDNSAAVHAQFWNHVENCRFQNWDTCAGLQQNGAGADGVNQNFFTNIFCASFLTGMALGARCGDNVIVGLFGSHSSASVFTDTLLVIGDTLGGNSAANQVFGLISDMGANGKAYEIKAGSTGNCLLGVDNESSLADIDGGTNSVILSNKLLTGGIYKSQLQSVEVVNRAAVFGIFALGSAFTPTKTHFVADADYTATTSDFYISWQTLTATRKLTLPSASAFSGALLLVRDESGNASGAVKIQGTAQVGQTLNGVAGGTPVDLITGTGLAGSARLYSNGSNWFTV